MMKKDNIGRDFAIKEAFARHFLKGIDEVMPVTREMESWLGRERQYRAAVCADRMIDDVEKLLAKYHQSANGAENGINSPLPMILIAFAKDNQPIAPDKGFALANPRMVQLAENGEHYKMRVDHIEKRVQIAFLAHTSETAKAMTSQMRLYFQRYGKYRFPVSWHFGGYDFTLTASLQEIPVTDDLADLPERTNLTVLTWNLILQCQIPYLSAPLPAEYTDDGKRKGYGTLTRVEFEFHGKQTADGISDGTVDTETPHPIHGVWLAK